MKSGLWLVAGTVGLIMSPGLFTVSAKEGPVRIPDTSVPKSGCIQFTINPQRLYAPFELQVFSRQGTQQFLFEDVTEEVFDQAFFAKPVAGDTSLSVNYIDRNGRVVPGETETGVSSENQGDCSVKLKLNFGLTSKAGSFEILNNGAGSRIASDYFDAIDPDGQKTNLDDWKRENEFFVVQTPTLSGGEDDPDIRLSGVATSRAISGVSQTRGARSSGSGGPVFEQKEPVGDDASAVYFNHGDLGFGRDMHMKRSGKNNKNLAFYVTNYRGLDDAINRDNPIATVAMEYSFGSRKGADKSRYIQFYAFDAKGDRLLSADLDGRGEKYLPQLCMTCHGGMQGDREITSSDIPKSGGLGARFLPFDLNAFDFSDANPSYSRAAQEADFKVMNAAIVEAFPTPAMEQLIVGWYSDQNPLPHFGSDRQPRANNTPSTGIRAKTASQPYLQTQAGTSAELTRTTQNSSYVPVGWRGEHAELYTEIVAPYCRGCHITRRDNLDWTTYEEFSNDGGRIKARVCEKEEETMPNAKATYQNMWLSAVDPIAVLTRHDIFTLEENYQCGQGPWARP